MTQKIKPLGNRVLIKRSKPLSAKGGILLPETSKEKPKEGEVIAVGPGRYDDNGSLKPVDLKVGDKVLFSNYAGTEVKLDDEDLLILSEDDVLVVLS
jgi:chaperonin GroES